MLALVGCMASLGFSTGYLMFDSFDLGAAPPSVPVHATAAAIGWAVTGLLFGALLLLPVGVRQSHKAIYADDWW